MSTRSTREIEAKFLDVDVPALQARLIGLGANDLGKEMYRERTFHFDAQNIDASDRIVRLRATSKGIFLCYKHWQENTVDGTEEIEFGIDDLELATLFVQRLGLTFTREQELKRQNFQLDAVSFEFNTWPTAPTIVGVEGPSEMVVRAVVEQVGLNWEDAIFENTLRTLVDRFNIPVDTYRIFTFEKLEKYND